MGSVKKSTKTSIFQTRFNGENASGYSQTQPLDAMDTNKKNRPMATYSWSQPIATCASCKHWIPGTARNGKSLSTSMGKCKEIFKNLAAFDSEIEGNNPFLESFVTESTFGCNGYQQVDNGNL
jgi:hypothetical protein